MHPVSYSILSPYVMAVAGVRTTMMVAGTVSAALLALLLVRSNALRQPLWPALYGAVALTGNAVSGRVTFGLGTMFALAALVVVLTPRHHVEGRRVAGRPRRGAGRAGDGGQRPGRALPGPGRRRLVPAATAGHGVRARAGAGGGGGLSRPSFFPFSGRQPMPAASMILPVLRRHPGLRARAARRGGRCGTRRRSTPAPWSWSGSCRRPSAATSPGWGCCSAGCCWWR